MSPSRRALLVLALAALAAPAVPAHAAPARVRTVCGIVKDDATDGGWDLMPLVSSPAEEILGVDIATGAKNLVAVLKLQSTTVAKTDPMTYSQAVWAVGFTINGNAYAFHRHIDAKGDVIDDQFTMNNTKLGLPTVTVGPQTITWTVPRAKVPDLAKPSRVKRTILEPRANTEMFASTSDTAFTPGVKYVDQTPSCLHPA